MLPNPMKTGGSPEPSQSRFAKSRNWRVLPFASSRCPSGELSIWCTPRSNGTNLAPAAATRVGRVSVSGDCHLVSGGAERVAEGDERLDIAATARHGHYDPHGAPI
jgi:hypothetical protein